MGPKKGKASKATLKKCGTMAATAAAGQEFLKQAWGEDKLKQVNALLNARDGSETHSESDSSSSSDAEDTAPTASTSKSVKTKAKPKLTKATTMKATAKEAKSLLGKQILGDTRSETKRRQAAVKAKKALQEVTNPKGGRKPVLKRLGTMANTAREGKEFVKRTGPANKKRANSAGRKSTKRGNKKSRK